MKYIIDEIPPSNNRFIGRNERWKYQEVKRYWEKLIAIKCRPKPNKPIEKATVTLTYYFPDCKRRDPDNYSGKMVLDGLVKAGIIKDDSFNNINLILKGKYDKENPKLEIDVQRDERPNQDQPK